MYPGSVTAQHDQLVEAVGEQAEADAHASDDLVELDPPHDPRAAREAVALRAQQLVIAIDAAPRADQPFDWIPTHEVLAAALNEARALANLALSALREMPCSLGEMDPGFERLPTWAGGDAETWNGSA